MKTADTVTDLAGELLRRLNALPVGSRLMLGIVGYPGAGKSTLAQALVEEINQRNGGSISRVVPMDGYHYSNEELDKMGLRALKGIPATFDAKSFVALLTKLSENRGIVYAPLFDRSVEDSVADAIEILPEQRILVIEGNYLLLDEEPWRQIKDLLDEVWFIDTTYETIMPRLIDRHRAGGRSEEGIQEKIASTDMPNARLIDATKPRANRLIEITL